MEENIKYERESYWDDRYSQEDEYEWFASGYSEIIIRITSFLKPTDRILMLGCGNSKLSQDIYKKGFHNIVNLDISQVCEKFCDLAVLQFL